MKQITLLAGFLLAAATAFAQIRVPVDSVYDFIKRNSVHHNDVDWRRVDMSFSEKLRAARSDVDSVQALVHVLEQMNDVHSSVMYNGRSFANYPAFDDAALKYLMPLVQLSGQRTGMFTAEILAGEYLYLQVPGIQAWGDEVTVYAQRLSDTLCRYLSDKTRGVVLDLRLNGGGQFSSMASGLALLLGDGPIGGGVSNRLEPMFDCSIQNSNLCINERPMTAVKHRKTGNFSNIPVAVLIGPNTRSSGSITALAFKGRKNTRFFGENTADGYTTGTDFFTFGNNLFVTLSTTYSVDRNRQVYKLSVPPDVVLPGADDFTNIENDLKVQAALQWLMHNKH